MCAKDKCYGCGEIKDMKELTLEKIKTKIGLYCDDCMAAWEDYVDRKIMERRGK